MYISNDLSQIAKVIKADWKKMYFGAVPYVNAMSTLRYIHDRYLTESAESIVTGFLVNAGTWKGETAKAVKFKLNNLLVAFKPI